MSTKTLIYQNAIRLFSEHGYSNIGMRELAKSAGIKASSIYNHYKSKDDLLMDIAHHLIDELSLHVYPLFKQTHLNPRDFFTNISIETNNFFEKAEINQLTRLLIPQQVNHKPLRDLLHTEFILKPRSAYAYYFKTLMSKGLMRKEDPILTAKLYHSFFVYHFYEKYLTDKPEGFLRSYEELFKEHIHLFLDYFNIQP